MMRHAILRGLWLAGTAAACVFPAVAQTAGHRTGHTLQRLSQPLAGRIAAILAPSAESRDHWGIEVTTLDGTVVYSLHGAQLFQPASNAKLFTTAAATALLPATHRFTTTITGDGLFQDDGTLRGNLTLNGAGDANFCAHDLPYPRPPLQPGAEADHPLRDLEELADQVKASGLKRVQGDVIATDSFNWDLYPLGWSADDLVWGYAAPVSGLSIADNSLELTISPTRLDPTMFGDPVIANDPIMSKSTMETATPGLLSAAAASVDQVVPYYSLQIYANSSTDKQPTSIRISRALGSHAVEVRGQIPPGANPVVEQIAIDDPEQYAAMALKQLLIERGIAVTGTAKSSSRSSAWTTGTANDFGKTSSRPILNLSSVPANPELVPLLSGGCGDCGELRTLATHLSPPISDDILVTNKESLNLHAELLLRQLGLAERAEGARVVRQFLINAGIDSNDFVFFDGSGLSTQDLVTPRATAKLLSFAAHDPTTGQPQPWFAHWKASLPVGGVDGTLASRFTQPPLKGHVFAKTGTLGEARALSGYLDAASGRTIIFSIFVGNHLPDDSSDRDAMDKIVAAIQAAE